MFRKILTVSLTFFVTYCLNGQTGYAEKLDALIEKGALHMYSNQDSAYHYFDNALKLSQKNHDWENMLNALSYSNASAGYFADLPSLRDNISLVDSLFRLKSSIIDTMSLKNELISSVFYDKGNYFFKIDQYTLARNNFQKLVRHITNIDENQRTADDLYYLSVAYSFLAKMLFNEKKYDQAREYYDLNIRLLRQKFPNEKDLLYGNYVLLAEVLREEGDLVGSNQNFKQVLTFDLAENSNNNRIISSALNLAQNHLGLSTIDSANYYLELARPFSKTNTSLNSFFSRTEAQVRRRERNFKESSELLEKAIYQLQSKSSIWQKAKITGLYLELGKTYFESGNMNKALQAFDLGLQTNRSAIDPHSIELLSNKTAVLNALGNHTAALQTSEKGISILDSLKISFISRVDKSNLIEESFPLFEEALKATLEEFQKTGNPAMVATAFRLMEKSKSVLLLDALLTANAEKFSGVSEDTQGELNALNIEITMIEKILELENPSDHKNLKDSLFSKKVRSRRIVQMLEQKFPKYYSLKYGNRVASVKDMLGAYSDNRVLVSFFYGNKAIYAVFLSESSQKLVRIDNLKVLEDKVKKYYLLLSNPQSPLSEVERLARELYQCLLSGFDLKQARSLIIIPDGVLNYLPFETLINAEKPPKYLFEDLAISYTPSATTLIQLNAESYQQNTLLAFAPKFQGEQINPRASRDVLVPLPFAQKEVSEIMNNIKGKAYLADEATIENFKHDSKNYGLLHFATHASFNDRNPEFSYLAFSPNTREPLLFVKDIYNQEVTVNMVTLSACETALGDLKRGEGFISLASSFFYAGAKSITSTLWKVSDISSSQLMVSFYRHLADGNPKDLALQKAKLEFLDANRQNGLSHPYYWSGFIVSGNTTPLASSNLWLWIILGIFILTIAGIILFSRRKNYLIQRL